ncbi:MAG: porin family protein [Mesorhizobium sp.]|nr:outer membrane beta-barrel protein [Mesorhizobium sp.]MBL8578867.1 porin family protein [Mesorhizobium sp.]
MVMKSRIAAILLGAVSLSALSTSIHAADAIVEMPVRTGFNWTGFHVGAAAGVGAFVLQGDQNFRLSGDGFFGEVSAGYDYMFSERFLLGAFADARYGGQEATVDGTSGSISLKQTLGFDVGLRAGYLVNPTSLAYVLGGYSWQRFEADFSIPILAGNDDIDGDGYTVGAGLETVVGGNWTLKNEYRFASYSVDDGVEEQDLDTQTYRVGLNYRFGADGGAEATFSAPAYNWTGFYIGAQLGALVAIDNALFSPLSYTVDGQGGDGGWGSLNVGYDQEFGNWVAGVQLGARYMSAGTSFINAFNLDRDYGFDVLARVGVKLSDTTLAYAIGGYTNQRFELDVQGLDLDWNGSGYTIGTGLETAVTDRLALNVEYRFSQFGDHDPLEGTPEAGILSYEPRLHMFGVGLKYKLN